MKKNEVLCIGFPKVEALNDLEEVLKLVKKKVRKWKEIIKKEEM